MVSGLEQPSPWPASRGCPSSPGHFYSGRQGEGERRLEPWWASGRTKRCNGRGETQGWRLAADLSVLHTSPTSDLVLRPRGKAINPVVSRLVQGQKLRRRRASGAVKCRPFLGMVPGPGRGLASQPLQSLVRGTRRATTYRLEAGSVGEPRRCGRWRSQKGGEVVARVGASASRPNEASLMQNKGLKLTAPGSSPTVQRSAAA